MQKPGRTPRVRLAAALGVTLAMGVLPAAKCFIGTDLVNTAFNEGLIDTSTGDPSREPHERAQDMVARRIYAELIDGYYGMGPNVGQDDDHNVPKWLRNVARDRALFAKLVIHTACREGALGDRCINLPVLFRPEGEDAGAPPATSEWPDAEAPSAQQSPMQQSPMQQSPMQQSMAAQLPGADEEVLDARARIRRAVDVWATRPTEAVCDAGGDGERKPEALTHFVDYLRFTMALERAVYGVAELLVEGLVTQVDVELGARRAFREAADYLQRRLWHRELDRRTTGLVVKGGAATGVFSAGIAWVALNVLNQYAAASSCGDEDQPPCPRFDLVAGTSTGAFVAVAVDRFASATTPTERQRIVDMMAGWFTCYALDEMFCLDHRPLTNLASDARPATGVLEFDGLRAILDHEVRESQLANATETILTTVDFRSGRLFNLSDQNRFELRTTDDIIDGVIASAVLPIFAKPVDWLRVGDPPQPPDTGLTHPDGGITNTVAAAALLDAGIIPAGRARTYLDGGIRSELPVLPLVRRGAERVLVASSSSSVLGETGRIDNALEIGLRYIDVSTGGITEGELAHARRHVESMRLAETIECHDLVRQDRLDAAEQGRDPVFCPIHICNVDALCAAHFEDQELCIPTSGSPGAGDAAGDGPTVPDPAAEGPAHDGEAALLDAGVAGTDGGSSPEGGTTDGGDGQGSHELLPLDTAPRVVLRRRWRLMGLFRDERIVGGVHGYDFNPADQRRLFLAGADAARRRCLELAELLGIPHDHEKDRAALVQWCSPRLSMNTCDCYAAHRRKTPDAGYRVCREHRSAAGDMAYICGSPAPEETK